MRAFLVLAGLCALACLSWLATRATERDSPSPRAGGASSGASRPDEIALPAPEEASAGATEARTSLAPAAEGPLVQWQEDAERASAITGRVRHPDGKPCPRAELRYAWDEGGRPREASARSDGEGKFVLELHAPDARGDLLALGSGDAPTVALGVAAGTQGLELVLPHPEFLTIEVRGARGETLAPTEAAFSWQLGGHLVRDSRRRGELASPLTWERPPVPFAVEVSARAHRTELFGPFDPADLGPLLVLELEPVHGVRGRVTHGGQPVSGAEVVLRAVSAELRWLDEWAVPEASVQESDAEGRFEFPQPRGRHELVAFALPHGQGVLGPLELDGASDLGDLELELTRAPGSIEGRVLLPAGHGPEELRLEASSRPNSQWRLEADGSFALHDLPPGACTVTLHVRAWSHDPELRSGWLATVPSYTVEVASGRATRLEIDLVGPAECRLEGAVRLDGRAPPLRSTRAGSTIVDASRAELTRGSRSTRQASAELDAEGGFSLATLGPGEYRLELALGIDGAGNETWLVRQRVALAPGVVPWRLDLATGSLRVVPPSGVQLPGLAAVWSGPDGVEVRVRYPEIDAATGQAFFQRVPAGKVRLGLNGAFAAEEAAVTCEVRGGEVVEVPWSP